MICGSASISCPGRVLKLGRNFFHGDVKKQCFPETVCHVDTRKFQQLCSAVLCNTGFVKKHVCCPEIVFSVDIWIITQACSSNFSSGGFAWCFSFLTCLVFTRCGPSCWFFRGQAGRGTHNQTPRAGGLEELTTRVLCTSLDWFLSTFSRRADPCTQRPVAWHRKRSDFIRGVFRVGPASKPAASQNLSPCS